MSESTTCSLGCKTRDGHPIRTHDGYSVCDRCAERLRQTVGDIVEFYAVVGTAQLPTLETLAAHDVHVRVMRPALGPQSPASDHIITFRDSRTVSWEPSDPHYPLAILTGWATYVREERHQTPPASATLTSESNTLLFNWDWLCRIESDLMAEFARELREVRNQLGRVVGEEGPKSVGLCIEIIKTDEGPRDCDTPLYSPKTGRVIQCRNCKREYEGVDLVRLRLAQAQRPATPLEQGAA